MAFKPATRKRVKARLAIVAMSKCGKSLTSLALMRGIVGPEGRIAALDSENGALSLYSGRFPGATQPTGFDVDELSHFSPDAYVQKIAEAAKAKYDGLIIDSGSHEWMGKGGVLEIVDGASQDKFFTGWKAATPKHNAFIQAIVSAPMHVIVTMRQKADYAIEKTPEGKNVPVKIGMQAVQREGFEYEFNAVMTMDTDHNLRVQYSAIDFLPNNTLIPPFADMQDAVRLGGTIRQWLDAGDEDWQAPTFKKSFYISTTDGPKEIVSAGVERDTYLKLMTAGLAYDKATKRGAAKALLAETMGRTSMADLTQPEGLEMLELLQAATKAAEEAKA